MFWAGRKEEAIFLYLTDSHTNWKFLFLRSKSHEFLHFGTFFSVHAQKKTFRKCFERFLYALWTTLRGKPQLFSPLCTSITLLYVFFVSLRNTNRILKDKYDDKKIYGSLMGDGKIVRTLRTQPCDLCESSYGTEEMRENYQQRSNTPAR